MRREKMEVKDFQTIEAIINSAQICRISMSNDNQPYTVPMCFGYEDKVIYLHCAKQGRKVEWLKSNPRICVEFDIDVELVKSEHACNFNMKYRSVIGLGRASFISDNKQKRKALDIMLKKYAGKSLKITDKSLNNVAIIKIILNEITGKISGYEK